jgi:cold-inducible RNA-binding protein
MNIYVGNLSYDATDDELRGLFEEFGEVSSASVIQDRESGRSRGFGFVEMPNDGEAQAAINALNGRDMQGRSLRVNEARPREERPRRDSGGFRSGGNQRGGGGRRSW